MKEEDLEPIMGGSIPQPEVNERITPKAMPEVKPEDVPKDSPRMFDFDENSKSVLETSNYETEPEEKGWFEDTWNVVKASANVSAAGGWAEDKLYEMGLKDVSPEVAGLYSALGADPEDLLTNFDISFEVNTDLIDMAMKAGVKMEFIPLVQGSYNAQNYVMNVQKALDYQKDYETIEKAPLGSQLVGGVVEAAFDPLSYATGGAKAGITFGRKAVITGTEAALGALGSEFFKEERTGKEAEYTKAAVGAFVFGTSLSALSDGLTHSVGTRMKARQDSLDANVDDVSKMSDVVVPEGKDFVEHPTEKGSVVTKNGDIISATNPVNPETLKAAHEANKGLKFMKLEDINQTVLTSENETARIIGSDLMRSSTGLKGGGTGKEGLVADDIINMMEGRDNLFVSDFMDASKKALDARPKQDREEFWRDILTGIETGKFDGFNEADVAVVNLWQKHMTSKFDAATNPSIFGNSKAKPIFKTKRDPNGYIPQVFEIGKVNMIKARLGSSEKLQETLKANWKSQIDINHNDVQGKLREIFNENNPKLPEGADAEELFKEFVEDYLEKKTYGIAKNGDFTHSSIIEDMNYNDGLAGVQNNNFALERNVFDSSFITMGTDGQPFALNDMRLMDLEELSSMYNRRINGDIAIHGATGKTTKELKDSILKVEDPAAQKALKDWIKLATGRSRRDPQGVWDALGRSLMDVTYASKNAMMWHMQAAEGVGFVADRTMKLIRGGVPAVKDLLNPKTKFSKKDMQDFRSMMFGQELNTRLATSYKGVKDALVNQGAKDSTASTIAGIRSATAWAAHKSPFTKIFNKTTETLTNLARNGVISDITDAAMLGKVKFTDDYLRNASITPEQYNGILKLLKENTKINKKGEYKADINKIVRDVRSNDLWRLADYVANDQVFRTNKISQNYTATPNTLGLMALQFKSFMIKGVNGKFLKMAYESGQGRAVDHMLNAIMATGVSSALYAAQAHYKAQGMTESKRQDYLDKQLSWGNVIYQGFSRSSVTGSPLGVANMGLEIVTGNDLFTAGRTTIVEDADKDYSPNALNTYAVGQKAAGNISKQFPTFATGAGLYTAAKEGHDWLWAEEGYDELSHGKAFFNALRQVLPNDPMMQALLNDMAENAGVLDKMN